jgi:UDPglucose 6-dehydrogenase
VVLLGVAYLENADDTRNTPAAALAKLLLAHEAKVVAHDPYVRSPDWRRALGNDVDVPLTDDLWAALNRADAAAVVTRHQEYHRLDLRMMKDIMRTPVLVDGRNVFDAEACRKAGMIYRGVGKR